MIIFAKNNSASKEMASVNIRWLALIPVAGLIVFVGFANHVHPYVFGLPFLFFYVVLWVILTSAVMAVIYAFDPANKS